MKSRFWFHEARLKIPLQTELSGNIEIQFFNNSLHSLPKIVNRKPTIYYPTKSAKTYFTAQDISPNLGLKVKFLCPIGHLSSLAHLCFLFSLFHYYEEEEEASHSVQNALKLLHLKLPVGLKLGFKLWSCYE